MIRRATFAVLLLVALWGCASTAPVEGYPGVPDEILLMGADVSFLDQLEENGAVYKADGKPDDALAILRAHGCNAVRFRLWHTPAEGYCDLGRTVKMARRAREAGMSVLLDLHYSDTWADPGKQYKPRAWESLPFAELGDSVYVYTRDVVAAFRSANALPEIVQIGNEITPGFLWDDGRVAGSFNTPEQWGRFGELLKAAISGARDALEPEDEVQIMIHIDRGGDASAAKWFYDHLAAEDVEFEMIGISYYPWWHGSLDDLRETMTLLAESYKKPIVVVETAYPWTLSWFDDQHNIIGLEDQLHSGYPATVEGQKGFLRDLAKIVRDTPGGLGLYYWAPEWIAVEGVGSAWENLTIFDQNGEIHIGEVGK